MEYQKIANLLENVSNEPSRFRTRNWVEINDDSRGTYTNADIKFKTAMLKSDFCDYCRCIHICQRYNNNYWRWT